MRRKGRRKQAEGRNQPEKGRGHPPLARAKVLRIGCGRRSGRLAGQALLGVGLPTLNELVGVKEQHGADWRLIEPAGLEEVWQGRLGNLEITRRQVNLSQAPIGQGDIDLHKQEDAGEPAFLAKTRLGPFGSGDSTPNDALLLGQLPPAGGDSAEMAADGHLSRAARVRRDEGRIAIGAIAVALPNYAAAFPRPGIGHFHINYPTFTITDNAYQKGRCLSILKSQPEIAARANS